MSATPINLVRMKVVSGMTQCNDKLAFFLLFLCNVELRIDIIIVFAVNLGYIYRFSVLYLVVLLSLCQQGIFILL